MTSQDKTQKLKTMRHTLTLLGILLSFQVFSQFNYTSVQHHLEIVIKNILGQKVHENNITKSTNSIDLNLQHLKKGVYIIDLLDNNSVVNTGKIIIK
jgi:hypothetical protein